MKKSTQQLYMERILKVLIFLQRNLDEEMSLDEYARVAHFSPYHFHRVFTGMVGESLHEHIRRLRLERAATRPRQTVRTIIEIAPDKIRYDACVTVDGDLADRDNAGVQTIGGSEYAVTNHVGPCTKLGQTYAKLLGQCLPRSG